MNSRSFAILPRNISPLKANQFLGVPPDLTGGEDQRQARDVARFLVIEETPEGFFLYRFDKDGQCVGDTWHANEEEAREQADYEYGKGTTSWSNIPESVDDVVKFTLAHINKS
jgi:hypothetical protein